MAWIKVRSNLDQDPRVFAMGEQLNVPTLHVVGMLWKVWSWADSISETGNAISVTPVTLDRITCCDGFATALQRVGWLIVDGDAISFPRYEEHNGKTAKTRLKTLERVQRHRNAKRVTKALPQRREEKSINNPPNPPLLTQSGERKSEKVGRRKRPPPTTTRERIQQILNTKPTNNGHEP